MAWTEAARQASALARRSLKQHKPAGHSGGPHHKTVAQMIKAHDYSYMFNANATGRTRMGDTVNKFLKAHPGGRWH